MIFKTINILTFHLLPRQYFSRAWYSMVSFLLCNIKSKSICVEFGKKKTKKGLASPGTPCHQLRVANPCHQLRVKTLFYSDVYHCCLADRISRCALLSAVVI